MNNDVTWFSTFVSSDTYTFLKGRPVAYFCAEFALSQDLPTYAGGLGVLAADLVREAADRDFPLVAVGLYYREGYVSQKVDENGEISEVSVAVYPKDTKLIPVVDSNNKQVTVKIHIADREVIICAWKLMLKNISIFLLDTNIDGNSPQDQAITNRLYTSDKENRLKQEIVLGLGGLRFLEAINIHPVLYHMNEGHSAMLSLELIRHEMQERKIGFLDAKTLAKQKIAFTNHTLLASGNDLFSTDLVTMLLSTYAEKELQVPTKEIIDLGRIQDSSMFSMTMCSLRMAGKSNAVSVLHAKNAIGIWPDYPMQAVTNGIHIPMWDAIHNTDAIWVSHQENKRLLLKKIQDDTGELWDENTLLLGWARRMVQYKRPLALFEDIVSLKELMQNETHPIRIVISGEAHPDDVNGLEMIKTIRKKMKEELNGMAVYIPNYDLGVAHILTTGCDVWLNTPVVGTEACGTSGMKAALNGCLPLTTKDGWIDEVELYGIGWILDNNQITQNILQILKQQILPMYYNRTDDIPYDWKDNMQHGRELIENKYSATRMFREYVQKMYLPMLQTLKTMHMA